jgi:hypothetical protein
VPELGSMNISIMKERMGVPPVAPLSTRVTRNSIPAVDGLLSRKVFPGQSNDLKIRHSA